MISATMNSLTHLLRQFRAYVTMDVIQALINISITLYSLDSKEIQKASLHLLRASIGCLSDEQLKPFLGQILSCLFVTEHEVISHDDGLDFFYLTFLLNELVIVYIRISLFPLFFLFFFFFFSGNEWRKRKTRE
jgi:hypothetical protein